MATRKSTKSKSSTPKASKGAEDTPEKAPEGTGAGADATPDATPPADAKAPEGANSGGDADAGGDEPTPIDPIVKLQQQRSEAEEALEGCLFKVAEAAGAGDEDEVLSLTSRMGELRSSIKALSTEIAETGFARRVEEAMRAFMEQVGEADIPEGDVRLQIIIDERKLVGVSAVRAISSRKSKRSGKKAALRSSKSRDPRLPPAGLTLPSQAGQGRGPCHVTYTEGADVRVSGPCADGSILHNEAFTSVSKAGLRVTGSPVNGYTWAQLGPKGHEWSGQQVDRKGNPVD